MIALNKQYDLFFIITYDLFSVFFFFFLQKNDTSSIEFHYINQVDRFHLILRRDKRNTRTNIIPILNETKNIKQIEFEDIYVYEYSKQIQLLNI